MSYKVGDKVSFEIKAVIKARRQSDGKEVELYRLKGINDLVFDGHRFLTRRVRDSEADGQRGKKNEKD